MDGEADAGAEETAEAGERVGTMVDDHQQLQRPQQGEATTVDDLQQLQQQPLQGLATVGGAVKKVITCTNARTSLRETTKSAVDIST